jgi:hypothetical protein
MKVSPNTALLFARRLKEELPHRGSTTAQEKSGLNMVYGTLEKHGLKAERETFRASSSAYRPGLFFSISQVLASAVYLFLGGDPLPAFVVAGLGLVYILADSALLDTPFSRNATSGNVWAEIGSSDDASQTIVLAAHVDTHRTPALFSSQAWLRAYRMLMPVAIGSSILALALYWFPVAGVLYAPIHAVTLLIVAALMVQADSTPYSNGANDNASGVGVLMALANHYHKRPLRRTRLVVLWTGCEEVGAYGSRDWARKRRDDYPGAYWISLDTLGGAASRPVYTTSEQFLLKTTSDPALVSIAAGLAESHAARPVKLQSAYTDSAPAARNGFRVMSVLAMTPEGGMPGWHRVTDTSLDMAALSYSLGFIEAVIEAIDMQGDT